MSKNVMLDFLGHAVDTLWKTRRWRSMPCAPISQDDLRELVVVVDKRHREHEHMLLALYPSGESWMLLTRRETQMNASLFHVRAEQLARTQQRLLAEGLPIFSNEEEFGTYIKSYGYNQG